MIKRNEIECLKLYYLNGIFFSLLMIILLIMDDLIFIILGGIILIYYHLKMSNIISELKK